VIEQAEALGEPPEDPLLLFSVLYGFVVASWAAFDGDVRRSAVAACSTATRSGSDIRRTTWHFCCTFRIGGPFPAGSGRPWDVARSALTHRYGSECKSGG
jgi:hypothetical protein